MKIFLVALIFLRGIASQNETSVEISIMQNSRAVDLKYLDLEFQENCEHWAEPI